MLDFCYFVNFSVVLQTAFFPDNLLWFKANYVLCMGPICIAIMVWKNSLVFHSLDKLTSFFLHAFPTMVSILIKRNSVLFTQNSSIALKIFAILFIIDISTAEFAEEVTFFVNRFPSLRTFVNCQKLEFKKTKTT